MFTIKIWATEEAADRPVPPKNPGYTIECGDWISAEADAIPGELYLSVPGLAKCASLTCDPEPNEYTVNQLKKYAERLAKNLAGAVEICGAEATERFLFPAGRNVYAPVRAGSDPATLALWFAPREGGKDRREAFAKTLFEAVPFAAPAGFGSAEGKEKFDAMLAEAKRLSWHGTGPVTNVALVDKPDEGSCGCAVILLNSAVMRIDEWREALTRVMCRLSLLYNAFFAQLIDGEAQVAATHWQGIPYEIGNACIVGKAYSSLISGTERGREIAGGSILFVEPDGPYVDTQYLSKRKKSIFGTEAGSGRGYLLASDFTQAKSIPSDCFER